MSDSYKISVVLVEDVAEFRTSTKQRIGQVPDMECIADFASTEALINSDLAGFDVLLLDNSIKDGRDGVDAIPDIRRIWPSGKIVMFSQVATDEVIFQALRSGATGFLFKGEVPGETFHESIRRVHRGEAIWTPTIAGNIGHFFAGIDERFGRLTSKQREVVGHLITGKSYDQIAKIMHVGIDTIRYHVVNINKKLEITSRAQLAYEAALAESVIVPQLHVAVANAAASSGSNSRATVDITLVSGDHDRDVDFSVLVSLPDGLSFDMSPSPQVGSFDTHRSCWKVTATPTHNRVSLQVKVQARNKGTFLVQATVAHCSQPIKAVTAACEISFL